MVGSRIDRVGADHIGSQLSQQRDITLAVCFIGQRIGELRVGSSLSVGRGILLVRNSLQEKLSSILVEEFRALQMWDEALGDTDTNVAEVQ